MPSFGQFHIAYDLLKNFPGAATGAMYAHNCELARTSGDAANIPSWRCSPESYYNMAQAIELSIIKDEHAHLLNKKSKVEFACVAEDARKGKEQVGLRIVDEDYRVWDVFF